MINSIAVKIQGLTKEFARDKKVIDEINLSVNKGELFCLVGASKTLLLVASKFHEL